MELLITYEGSRFVVNDMKLLMDTFHREEFSGTWRRLFSRVKKHIIWGVLKSVTGMQVRPFYTPTSNKKKCICDVSSISNLLEVSEIIVMNSILVNNTSGSTIIELPEHDDQRFSHTLICPQLIWLVKLQE